MGAEISLIVYLVFFVFEEVKEARRASLNPAARPPSGAPRRFLERAPPFVELLHASLAASGEAPRDERLLF